MLFFAQPVVGRAAGPCYMQWCCRSRRNAQPGGRSPNLRRPIMDNPWKPNQPEGEVVEQVAPQLATCEPVYAAMMRALHACSRDQDLSSLAAAVAMLDFSNDFIVNSGLLWVTPDFVASLRVLTDELEARQKDGPARPLQPTLREYFANARPAVAN
jgi:hypothetical protein